MTIQADNGNNKIQSLNDTTIQVKGGILNIIANNGKNEIIADKDKEIAIEATHDANIHIEGVNNSILGKIGISVNGTQGKNEFPFVNMIAKGENGNNIINVESQGILSNSANINLEAKQNNIIKSQNIGIEAKGKNAIIKLIADKNNYINAKKGDGVYVENGATVNIIAGDKDINWLTDYIDVDNIILSGDSALHTDSSGVINAIADHDNIIAGTNNGILSDGTGEINVTAGNNNYIGQYTDEEGNIHTSENGINVSEGTVTVTSGNENYIYGIDNGIIATGNNNIVNLSGKENNIIVKNIEGNATGINIKDRATINLNKDDGLDNQSVNIDVVSKNGNAIGIDVENNSTLKMDKPIGDLIINAEGTTSATGIYVRQNDAPININSNGNIVINAKSDDLSGSSGIVFSKSNGKIKANDNIIINNVTNIEDINKSEFGITINNDSELILDSNLNIINGRKAIDVGKVAPVAGGSPNDDSKLDIVATSENGGNYITATENGISVVNRKDSESMSTVNLDGKNNIINIYANTNAGIVSGISSADGAVINIGKKEDVIHSERTEINVVNDINSKASYIYMQFKLIEKVI